MPLDGTEFERELKTLQGELKTANDKTKGFAEEAHKEIKALGVVSTETKAKADEALTKLHDLLARVGDVEQKMARRAGFHGGGDGGGEAKTIGQRVVDDDEFKALAASTSQRGRATVEVKTITTAADGVPNLALPDRRPGLVQEVPDRRLTVRDLLTPGQTTSGMIEYVRELMMVNNAAPVAEGALKPESSISFDLKQAGVRVIAHWMQASKQVLSDVPQLRSIIDGRLRYGLALKEEDQLLNGDGTGQNLLGLIPQATAYTPFFSAEYANPVDHLRLAMLQAVLAEYPATGHVLNPIDWARIELAKDNNKAYLWSNPQQLMGPTLWGLPVVTTTAMSVDKFLTGAFKLGAQIFDRWDATVQVSTEDRDNFIRNLVTILAEERLGLAVYRPQCFIHGDFGLV